ncbi:MAG TPA: 50S ribosomal protein L5 [Armatimonadota bacterium]|nr:50S ribosomal protein L5 [Armatimonadota bacterium]
MSRLKERYRDDVIPGLMKEFNYKNVMQVPRVEKVVINMGVGTAVQDAKTLDAAVRDMTAIAGQKPVVTRAKKSIAAFKIREGMRIGCKVTLRGQRMWHFLDKLFNVTIPRIRDFGGINPDSFDGHGNFAMGLKEQLVFPEIEYDQVDRIRGMDIAIGTTAATDQEGRALLRALGLPFRGANRGERL